MNLIFGMYCSQCLTEMNALVIHVKGAQPVSTAISTTRASAQTERSEIDAKVCSLVCLCNNDNIILIDNKS